MSTTRTNDNDIPVIKLDDFEEYPVIRDEKYQNQRIDLDSLPTIDIQPIRKDPRSPDFPDDDPIFTRSYFKYNDAILEENGYFARGDTRPPDMMGGKIPPKCHAPGIEPHHNIRLHRQNSDCSRFVSLTDKMSIAHAFGKHYEDQRGQSGYYVYIAEMDRGIWMQNPPFPGEREHTAIGSVPIVSYRKCFSGADDKCSSIFVKKDLPIGIKEKLIAAQLLPYEKITSSIKDSNDETFGSTKAFYELWRRDENQIQQKRVDHKQIGLSFNPKIIPRRMDTSPKEKNVEQIEKLIWQQLLDKKPETKPTMDWERYLHPTDFAAFKMENLKKRIDIYHTTLSSPSVFKQDKNVSSFLLNESAGLRTPIAPILFNLLDPSATKGLQPYSDYLLGFVQKSGKKSVAYKDALYGLQVKGNLSPKQTELLGLYTSARIPEHKGSVTISATPDPALLKFSLQTLETSIRRDLSLHPDKSAIFQAVQQTSKNSQAIIREAHSFKGNDKAFTQRIEQTREEINAVTGFCGQVARLSSSKAARQITRIGGGASQMVGAMGALSMGHPVLGLLGMGTAILSMFDDDDDDDDNGMQILSNQIGEVHHDMIKGFNEVLSEQIRIAQELSHQMLADHQQTMSRFDHVDYNLAVIQRQIDQTYQYLTAQNSHISHQISMLSQQLSESEINILKGLQAVHTDIVRCLKIVSEGISKGFTHLDEQLCKGFNHLDKEVQILRREMHATMAQQMLYEREYFKSLSSEQAHQSDELKKHSIKIDAIRQLELNTRKNQNDAARKNKESNLTKYADRVLLDDFPIETFDKSELDYSFSKATDSELTADKSLPTSEDILSKLGNSRQWHEINPFDYINLLHHRESKLVHFPTQQKNMDALLKRLLLQKTVTPKQISQLKGEVEKNRDILRFCHTLGEPSEINAIFSEISKNVAALGAALEKQLTSCQEEYNIKCKQQLQDALDQNEINRSLLKSSESKEVLADRMKQSSPTNVFDEKIALTESVTKLRLQFNYKLQQDLSNPEIQTHIEALEASVGLLHVKLKLIFESFYLNKDQTLYDVLESCLTTNKLKQILAGYRGDSPHPYVAFKNAKQWYDQLANNLIDALTKRTLYVDNVTLTNALLLLDSALLEFMPQDERLGYLNQILAKLPESAKASMLLLRGTLLATEKHDMIAALADYKQASALHPDDNQMRLKYAECLFALSRFEDAIEECNQILAKLSEGMLSRPSQQQKNDLYINSGVILLLRGDAYFASGHPAAAFGDYQGACQLLRDQPEVLYKRGLSYQALDKLDLAIEYYKNVLELAPKHYQSMYGLATCLFKQEQRPDAFVWYQKLLEQSKNSIEFKLQCAECGPKEDKRVSGWLKSIVNDPKASTDEILRCSELFLKRGELVLAQIAYDKIKANVTTPNQYERSAAICLRLKDTVQWAICKKKLLALQGMFKPTQVDNKPINEIGKKHEEYQRISRKNL